MTLQEIIKTIETCYTASHSCTECTLFTVDECNEKLMRAVLALLKEQVPRVMTLEELCLWDGSFMLETIVGDIGWASYFGEYDQYGDIICRIVDIDGGVNDRYKSMYGFKWRCWTSRPTDEQRKAVKWDDSN